LHPNQQRFAWFDPNTLATGAPQVDSSQGSVHPLQSYRVGTNRRVVSLVQSQRRGLPDQRLFAHPIRCDQGAMAALAQAGFPEV